MNQSQRDVQAVVFNKHGVGHLARVERFPLPGETIRATEWHFGEDAGKGTNVAVVLAKQGVKTAFVSKVGMDENGRLGEKWLLDAGVDCSRYIMSPDFATDVGVVIAQANGENMVIGSPKHECRMSMDEVKEALNTFPNSKYFLSGFEINQQISLEACRYAKSLGMITFLNPSPLTDEVEGGLDYIDYLFINEVEGVQLAKMRGDAEKSWSAIAERVREIYHPATVVMTLGREGCMVCDHRASRHFPSYEVTCVDSVAAGDAFMAAFASRIIEGCEVDEAADWGNRYSAVTVSRAGSILSYPDLEEAKAISDGLKRRQTNGGT